MKHFGKIAARTSNGVLVEAENWYQPDYSNPMMQEFMFAYKITVRNETGRPVQLLHRHWYIVDATGFTREVDGVGVVGKQPRFKANEEYIYLSGCNLTTEIGLQHGYYTFKYLDTDEVFQVYTPVMNYCAPYKLN